MGNVLALQRVPLHGLVARNGGGDLAYHSGSSVNSDCDYYPSCEQDTCTNCDSCGPETCVVFPPG